MLVLLIARWKTTCSTFQLFIFSNSSAISPVIIFYPGIYLLSFVSYSCGAQSTGRPAFFSLLLMRTILFTFCLFIQTTDVDWTEAVIPFAIIVFLVFIFDFYIESFCLAKLESTRTGKVGSISSFLCAVVLSFLWDQPWAWSMHEWHHGKPSEPHLVSAGTLFAAFFFVLGEWFDANIGSLPSAGK